MIALYVGIKSFETKSNVVDIVSRSRYVALSSMVARNKGGGFDAIRKSIDALSLQRARKKIRGARQKNVLYEISLCFEAHKNYALDVCCRLDILSFIGIDY